MSKHEEDANQCLGVASRSGHLKAANADLVTVSDDQFTASPFRWNADFFGVPEPDRAGSCDMSATGRTCPRPRRVSSWRTIPSCRDTAGVASARRCHCDRAVRHTCIDTAAAGRHRDARSSHWQVHSIFEVVRRGADGVGLIQQVAMPLDGYVRAGKVEHYMIVLDNIPFAFVRPENRFYVSYGNGAAPDSPAEFGAFVGDLVKHLVSRYGAAVVSKWRFRLGTECDGPRIGPSWENFTAPNAPFVMPGEDGRNFTTRTNGLDAYVAT